jgi:hypothetical protein
MRPNQALHLDAPALLSGRGFPRSLRSLGAGERGRYTAQHRSGDVGPKRSRHYVRPKT